MNLFSWKKSETVEAKRPEPAPAPTEAAERPILQLRAAAPVPSSGSTSSNAPSNASSNGNATPIFPASISSVCPNSGAAEPSIAGPPASEASSTIHLPKRAVEAPPPSESSKRQRADVEPPPPDEDDDWDIPYRAKTISEEELREVRAFARARDEYKLEAATTRNVIIVGRTRAGKSTFVEVLKDVTYQPPPMSIFSQTKEPAFRPFAIGIDGKPGSIPQKYTINIVDTPGLFEVKQADSEERANLVIMNTIQNCIKNEITKIHSVIIFMTVTHGVSQEDLEAIDIFLRDFASSQLTACICISRAEGFSLEQQTAVIQELKKHRSVGQLLDKHTVQILFSGCVDTTDTGKYYDKEQLKIAYRNLYHMRTKILKTIFAAEDAAPLLSLGMGKKQMGDAQKLVAEALNFLESCKKPQDFTLASNSHRLTEQCNRMHQIADVMPIIQTDAQLLLDMKRLERALLGLKDSTMYGVDIMKRMAGPFEFNC